MKKFTKKQRLINTFNKTASDRMPWTVFIDSKTRIPGYNRKNIDSLEFYKHIDCDILILEGWGTPYNFQSPEHILGDDVQIITDEDLDAGSKTIRLKTKSGDIVQTSKQDHPVKYFVENEDDLRIYLKIWQESYFKGDSDADTVGKIENLTGDNGIVMRFCGTSAVPLLLEEVIGIENFYYLLNDHKGLMEELIKTIHDRQMQAYKILSRSECDIITLIENTSTYYISPEIYHKYNMPHQRDFVNEMKSAGKTAILHMCGHIRNILDLIKETNCDGIHALTGPPTGDCPWEDALDVLGEELIIVGAVEPTILMHKDPEKIKIYLDDVISGRIKDSNFILLAGADGADVPLNNFLTIREWMEDNY